MGSVQHEYGMIGLGTMGRNLVLNMADKGFSVAGYDKDPEKAALLQAGTGQAQVQGFSDLPSFIAALKKPFVILLLVPAGPIVDAVINDLTPHLSEADLLVDCGNSHFTDTERRIKSCASRGIHFMGAGISGGESGARFGPSIMPGGDKTAYDRMEPMLRSIAAKVNDTACVSYMGTGSAGHFVKMVHNGIEYAQMQAISEGYQLLKQIGLLTNEELALVFESYNHSPIQSYLIEITSGIFLKKDNLTQAGLIDRILDTAHQKGTGAWASQSGMNLQVPIPAIDAAVTQRLLSGMKEQRVRAANLLHKSKNEEVEPGREGLVPIVRDAIHFCMITGFAQGMALLQQASVAYKYGLNLAAIASTWRGGCIIRAAMLEDMETAFTANPKLPNLMVNNVFSHRLNELQHALRSAIHSAVGSGIPVPVMMANLSYFDSYRSEWLPANLVQAQRDLFGAHTYERTDAAGTYHTEWENNIL